MSTGAKIGLWILAALVLAFAIRQIWPERVPGPVRIEVRRIPDSTAYRMAALELEGVKGRLALERQRTERLTHRAADWQERASMYRALYESMRSDTGTLDIVGRLDTLYQYMERMITCPRCGFEQPETHECVKCGVTI